jgi:cytidylate kinase
LLSLRGFSLSGEDLESRLDGADLKLLALDAEPGCRVMLKDEDVSESIRTQHVTDHIRPISGDERIRDWVTDFLRTAAKGQSVVMDGRDIGSVVFPDASHKFFITASTEARVKRRLADLGPDEVIDPIDLAQKLEERDQSDRQRKVGPLVQVKDAICIDNSELSLESTVQHMMHIIEGRKF